MNKNMQKFEQLNFLPEMIVLLLLLLLLTTDSVQMTDIL